MMSEPRDLVIGIDQGTTNTKAVAVDHSGRIVAEAARPIATHAPEPGAVEQDAEAMVANIRNCVSEVLARVGGATRIAALGIANQTETLVVWDRRTGKPAAPAMVWQCRRGAAEIAPMQANAPAIKMRTGLDLDPTFTAAKLKWFCTHRSGIAEGLRKGDLLFGTVDSWLIWSLTGGAVHATDASNASRTMLLDINRAQWDRELAAMFGLAIDRFAECRASNAHFGETDAALFGSRIPITGVMGDQQAALFGHGCFDTLDTKVTYGTGAFLWVNAGQEAREAPGEGIIRTIAWQIDRPCYAYEGFIMYAGKILEWLAQRLAEAESAAGVAAEAEKAGTSAGVMIIPAFQGLASPWWQPEMRAVIAGLNEATGNGHIAHAGLEAVCFQLRAVIDLIERHRGKAIPLIKIDGGMTRSRYFTQLQANVLKRPLAVAASDSMTPLGAALMAGLGAGFWSGLDELRAITTRGASLVSPDEGQANTLDQNYAAWRALIDTLIAAEAARS
jgi:glycerol kinase